MRPGAVRRRGLPSRAPSAHRAPRRRGGARGGALVADAAREAVAERGRFTLALAGGDTPRRLYQRLAADPAIDWSRVEFFWGDERPVPPEHPESNFGMAREALLRSARHRSRAGPPNRSRARRSGRRGARVRGSSSRRVAGERARGDRLRASISCCSGSATDGHTASLFPYTAALSETRRWVVANDVPRLVDPTDHDHVSADRARARRARAGERRVEGRRAGRGPGGAEGSGAPPRAAHPRARGPGGLVRRCGGGEPLRAPVDSRVTLESYALDQIRDGQVVGLGSGRAAERFVRALGARVADGLDGERRRRPPARPPSWPARSASRSSRSTTCRPSTSPSMAPTRWIRRAG